jgi:hypothetical protein
MADRACGLELETEKLRQSGQFALLSVCPLLAVNADILLVAEAEAGLESSA